MYHDSERCTAVRIDVRLVRINELQLRIMEVCTDMHGLVTVYHGCTAGGVRLATAGLDGVLRWIGTLLHGLSIVGRRTAGSVPTPRLSAADRSHED